MNRRCIVPMLALLLAGCDEPITIEYLYPGTQLAVEACMKRNASPLVDAEVIKANCIRKHEKKIDPQILDSTQSTLTPILDNPYGLGLEAVLRNTSNDQIITMIIITVMVHREGSPDLVFLGALNDLWIYPNSSGGGYVRYVSPDSEVLWTEAKDLMKAGAKLSWYISEATGLGFKLKT